MSPLAKLALTFACALAATIAAELPLAFAFFHPRGKAPVRTAAVVILMNTITNPALNLILAAVVGSFGKAVYPYAVAVGEISVVAAEAFILDRALDAAPRRAITASLALNAASFAAGIVLNKIFT